MTTITKLRKRKVHSSSAYSIECVVSNRAGLNSFISIQYVCVFVCIFFDGQFISKIESNLNASHKWFLVKSFTATAIWCKPNRWECVRDRLYESSMVNSTKTSILCNIDIRYNMFNASISRFPWQVSFYSSHPFTKIPNEKYCALDTHIRTHFIFGYCSVANKKRDPWEHKP